MPWQSPELLKDAARRTFQSNVYVFGITIFEILSGKGPYSHHSGIGSNVTGILLSSERPPKEPMNVTDGSSYSQLWVEATKCWDEDPRLRPSVSGVVARLDRHRAEALITTQHIGLETPLDLSISHPMSEASASQWQSTTTPKMILNRPSSGPRASGTDS